MNNNIGMNNTNNSFESLPLMKSFIIFPPKYSIVRTLTKHSKKREQPLRKAV